MPQGVVALLREQRHATRRVELQTDAPEPLQVAALVRDVCGELAAVRDARPHAAHITPDPVDADILEGRSMLAAFADPTLWAQLSHAVDGRNMRAAWGGGEPPHAALPPTGALR